LTTVDDIITNLPIGSIAARLGIDEATARSAVQAAVPALTGGLTANSQSASGAQSLAEALQQHAGGSDAAADVSTVDEADGQKIVQHIFGAQQSDVIQRLGGTSGPADSSVFAKLLPLLAPLVLAQVAKHVGAAGGQQSTAPSGGGLGDLLGSLVGGAGGSKGIEDLLGGLLEGGRK
jgi:hypothetical protein